MIFKYFSKCQEKYDPEGVVSETNDVPRTRIIYHKYYYNGLMELHDTHTDTKNAFATRDHRAKEKNQDNKNNLWTPQKHCFSIGFMNIKEIDVFLIFEFLTAWELPAHFEKSKTK